jgi:ornithine carbamoyltransferase
MTKDFLSLFDIAPAELEELFKLTDLLKTDPSRRPLAGKTAALIFQKPSLRTRVSFEVGIYQLGGYPVFLSNESIGIDQREPAADIARLLSRYNDLIIARLFAHSLLLELAKYSTVPVINALTDLSHPCQVLADLYTLRQRGLLRKGIKIAFIGDGNNVANSWLEASSLFPMHFVLAAPRGYEPNHEILERARKSGVSDIEIVTDPAAAARNADVLYTDVWTSMGQEGESEKRRRDFAGYQVNEQLLTLAKPDCVVMHCLPAHRGEEVSLGVLDGDHSIIFDQAENRLHVQKAIMAELIKTHAAQHEHAGDRPSQHLPKLV